MKTAIFGAALAGMTMAMGAAPAQAQDRQAMMAAMFPDPNGDGATSKDEMIAGGLAHFKQVDANGDGVLDSGEMESARGGRMLSRADSNGDGKLTQAEMTAALGTRFARMDGNHDGKIDKAERQAMVKRLRKMRGGN